MATTWFTSDTHYGHKNIVYALSSWKDKKGTRLFNTLEEMNSVLVNNINQFVKEDDILYHLGDFALGGKQNVIDFRNQIKCKTIHLILGNHDNHIAQEKELQDLFTSVQTTIGYPRTKKDKGEQIIMCHFPIDIWDKHDKGVIHLHGHCHGGYSNEINKKRKMMDVGVDTHKEFRPYSYDEIKKIMESREIIFLDHHNNTNS